MKSLDFFINEPYLMDGVGSSTSGNTLTSSDDQWKFKQNPADSENSDPKPTDGTSKEGSGSESASPKVDPEAAKKQFGFSVIRGKDGVEGYNLTGQDIDGDGNNDTLHTKADGSLDLQKSTFTNSEKLSTTTLDDLKKEPNSRLSATEIAWSDTIKKTQEKANDLRSQAGLGTEDPQGKDPIELHKEADRLDALLTKPAEKEAGEAGDSIANAVDASALDADIPLAIVDGNGVTTEKVSGKSMLDQVIVEHGLKELNFNDSTHRDMLEKAGILDKQNNSATFFTMSEDGKSANFTSQGPEADLRMGTTTLENLKSGNFNFGAGEGWDAVDKNSELGKQLAAAHTGRKEFLEAFSKENGTAALKDGFKNYENAQKLRGRVDNLQDHVAANPGQFKDSVMKDLNALKGKFNNMTDASELKDAQASMAKLLEVNNGMQDHEYTQRKSEFDALGGLNDETLEQALSDPDNDHEAKMNALDEAVDRARDTKMIASFNKAGFGEAGSFAGALDKIDRTKLSDSSKAILGHLEKLTKGKSEDELKKMGGYLAAELKTVQGEIKTKEAAEAAEKKKIEAEGTRGTDGAIDFNTNQGAAEFRNAFLGEGAKEEKDANEAKLKSIFGDDYAKNPEFKKAINDFSKLDESAKGDFLKQLKSFSKENTPEKAVEKLDSAIAKKLKDSSDKKQILSKEDAEKNAKLISELKNIEEAKRTDEQKSELAKLEAEAKTSEDTKKLLDNAKALSETLKKYTTLPDGQLARKGEGNKVSLLKTGETGTVEGEKTKDADSREFKADPVKEAQEEGESKASDALKATLNELGITKEEDIARLANGGIVDLGAKWCVPCRAMEPAVEKLEKEGFAIAKNMKSDELNVSVLKSVFGVNEAGQVEPSFPTLVQVNSDGTIAKAASGQQSEQQLRTLIKELH